jgi:thiamine biosynthesis lipoprotein
MTRLSRRRFIAIAGIAAGASLVGGRPSAAAPIRWTGTAMGADASITLYHPDAAEADRLIADAVAEIERVEAAASLFRRDSALVRLNRDGLVDPAPAMLTELVGWSRQLAAASDGAFDVTVQPLWGLYTSHFARPGASPDGPSAAWVAEAASRIGWADLVAEGGAVRFLRPGMAATFNGIAQGYVTDRVSRLLADGGIRHMLVNLGEFRALGRHADGRPWRVGVADPLAPDWLLETVELDGQALASSGGYGTVFDPLGRFHHLFDPASGRPSPSWAGVTVKAASATLADGLSTALAVAPPAPAQAILDRLGGEALLVAADGARLRLRSNG